MRDRSRRRRPSSRSPAAGQRHHVNTGRMFIALKPLDERDVAADEVIARLRPKLAKVPGATCSSSRAGLRIGGRQGSAQYQYTLQGDDLEELRRVGAADAARRCARMPELARRQQRPAEPGPAGAARHRPRHRRAARASRTQLIDDDALRRLRPAPGLDHLHAAEPVPRRAGGGAASSGRAPTRSRNIYVRSRPRRQVPLTAFTALRAERRPARREPPGPVPVGHALLQPGAGRRARRRRRARSTTRRASIGMPAEHPRQASRARRRPSRPRWPTSRC